MSLASCSRRAQTGAAVPRFACVMLLGLLAGCGRATPASAPTFATAPQPDLPAAEGPVLGRGLAAREVADEAPQTPTARPWPRPSEAMTEPGLSAAQAKLADGEDAMSEGEFARAERLFQAAAALDRAALPYVQLARLQLQALRERWPSQLGAGEGDARLERAARSLDGWLSSAPAPLHPLLQLERARWAVVSGEPARSRELLLQALTEPPRAQLCIACVAEVHSLLGISQLALGELELALAPLQRAAQLEPNEASRHGNVGTAYIMNGRVREAVRAYQERARLAPELAQAHADLGVALSQAGEPGAGVRALQRAVALEPSHASYRANLGYALLRSGARSEARRELERAVQLDPRSVVALLGLSGWHASAGHDLDQAERWLSKAEALAPGDPRVAAARTDLVELRRNARGLSNKAQP